MLEAILLEWNGMECDFGKESEEWVWEMRNREMDKKMIVLDKLFVRTGANSAGVVRG